MHNIPKKSHFTNGSSYGWAFNRGMHNVKKYLPRLPTICYIKLHTNIHAVNVLMAFPGKPGFTVFPYLFLVLFQICEETNLINTNDCAKISVTSTTSMHVRIHFATTVRKHSVTHKLSVLTSKKEVKSKKWLKNVVPLLHVQHNKTWPKLLTKTGHKTLIQLSSIYISD